MEHDCRTRLAETCGTRGRGKQGDAIGADNMSPQIDDRGPRLMSSPHQRHRQRIPNLMTQSKKGVGHDTLLRPWSAMGASSTNRVTRRRLGQQCHRTMSGGFNGRSSHSEWLCARLQARLSRECMMNDSSRDGRLYCVVQRSPKEKPEVYRYRCCVGWFCSD